MLDQIISSFRDGFATADIGTARIFASLLVSVAAALYIYLVYRFVCRNSGVYSPEFNRSCALMSVITCGVILAMQSSLIISLGMVGALSLIRFRNAVKSHNDMLFLFWSFAAGIVCGTGLYHVLIFMSLILTAGILFFGLLPVMKAPMLLIVSSTDLELSAALNPLLKRYARGARVRSRTVTPARVEMIIELRVRDESGLVRAVSAIPGVESVTLMEHS
ncbi:MAG: DUF4956 domain-containing protein, partial [Clostridia bacterium]|nr:DUF4956 domain-containing protein [Clostridia bacterium]